MSNNIMIIFKINDKVRVNKDIFRKESVTIPYAISGEEGMIVRMFPSWNGKNRKPKYNAIVNINGILKTFRITSLDIV